MKLLLSLLFSFSVVWAYPQLSVQVASTYNSIPGWQVAFENGLTGKHSPFMRYGTMIGFRYQLPITGPSFYFAPTIALERNTQDYKYHLFELDAYHFQGIAGYRFLANNKKEPTFSVNAELSFGAGLATMRYNRPAFSDGEYTGEHEQFGNNMLITSLGLNLTTKIFISEKLSFGPMAGWRYVPKLHWPELPILIDPSLPASLGNARLTQWTLGVLLHWHFAKRKP